MDAETKLFLGVTLSFLIGVFSWILRLGFTKADKALKEAEIVKNKMHKLERDQLKFERNISKRLDSIEATANNINHVMITVARLEENSKNLSEMIEKMEAHLLRIEKNVSRH